MMTKNHQKSLAGFTLIEMLIVLSLVTIFTIIPTMSISRWQKVLQGEQFIATFEKQLAFIQQNAIVQEKDMTVVFSEAKQQFILPEMERQQEYFWTLAIPEDLKVTGPSKIVFLRKSGNNGRLEKYTFIWQAQNKQIEFQFQLGSGKYVKKITSL